MASIKRRGEVIRIDLRPEERMILAGFAREVEQMLGAEPGTAEVDPLAALTGLDGASDERPDDPAVARLLPDAYADPAAAAEFRRLTSGELRRTKSSALAELATVLEKADGRIDIDVERADAWLSAINDIRLVIATRLGVDDDAGTWRRGMTPEDHRLPLASAYDWLSMVQELLVDALT